VGLRSKIFKKGKEKVSRKSIYVAITGFLTSLGGIMISIVYPVITIPTWMIVTPMVIGFLGLAYDTLAY